MSLRQVVTGRSPPRGRVGYSRASRLPMATRHPVLAASLRKCMGNPFFLRFCATELHNEAPVAFVDEDSSSTPASSL